MTETVTTTPPPRRFRRPPHRLALLASVCVLALSTCASGLSAETTLPEPVERQQRRLLTASQVIDPEPVLDSTTALRPRPVVRSEPVRTRQDAAPEPPKPQEAPEVVFEPVTAERPTIRLEVGDASVDAVIAAVLAFDHVSFATAVDLDELAIRSEKGIKTVTVAAVDPTAFRRLTPQVTADAVDVWRRIVEGDAAFTHDVGHNLALELGARVPVSEGEDTVRVGAYASNGVPPVADAVVARETADALGLQGTPTVYVSLAEGVDPQQIAPQLSSLTGVEAQVIEEPPTRRAFLTGAAARQAFEPFTYVSIGDGMIQIDREWVRSNIVSAQVPIFRGRVICHRLMINQLRGALQEVVDEGLDHLIDPSQYGGCWVPRHILFNPQRGLSMHAWGLAVDFNVKGNEYGNREPEMDPRIVEIFERWGFAWGGHWSTPDGMHFELAALLQAPPD